MLKTIVMLIFLAIQIGCFIAMGMGIYKHQDVTYYGDWALIGMLPVAFFINSFWR